MASLEEPYGYEQVMQADITALQGVKPAGKTPSGETLFDCADGLQSTPLNTGANRVTVNGSVDGVGAVGLYDANEDAQYPKPHVLQQSNVLLHWAQPVKQRLVSVIFSLGRQSGDNSAGDWVVNNASLNSRADGINISPEALVGQTPGRITKVRLCTQPLPATAPAN